MTCSGSFFVAAIPKWDFTYWGSRSELVQLMVLLHIPFNRLTILEHFQTTVPNNMFLILFWISCMIFIWNFTDKSNNFLLLLFELLIFDRVFNLKLDWTSVFVLQKINFPWNCISLENKSFRFIYERANNSI